MLGRKGIVKNAYIFFLLVAILLGSFEGARKKVNAPVFPSAPPTVPTRDVNILIKKVLKPVWSVAECVHLLLAHGAPVKVKNLQGWSPLAEAISYGDRQTSKL